MFQSITFGRRSYRLQGALVLLAIGTLTACSQQDSVTNPKLDTQQQVAIVATVAADYSSGAHAVISRDENNTFTSLNNLLPTDSDITVEAHGDYFYRIERAFAGNNITKFSVAEPQAPIWQYSTNEKASSVLSDPHAMVFASDQKAYVLRYGDTRAWIVNPSAGSEAEFKIGELDLSAYADADGVPEMDGGIIVGNRLFIMLQRLENFAVSQTAYLAVFDINSDEEIDANIDGDDLKGIPLRVRNPTNIVYETNSNMLYVQGSGSFFPVEYTGGIEQLNPVTMQTTMILDDGDADNHPYGQITELAAVNENTLYFVGYDSYTENTLYRLELDTNAITQTSVTSFVDGQIGYITVDNDGMLWVSDSANATVRIIDAVTDMQIDAVSTSLNPDRIVFANQPD